MKITAALFLLILFCSAFAQEFSVQIYIKDKSPLTVENINRKSMHEIIVFSDGYYMNLDFLEIRKIEFTGRSEKISGDIFFKTVTTLSTGIKKDYSVQNAWISGKTKEGNFKTEIAELSRQKANIVFDIPSGKETELAAEKDHIILKSGEIISGKLRNSNISVYTGFPVFDKTKIYPLSYPEYIPRPQKEYATFALYLSAVDTVFFQWIQKDNALFQMKNNNRITGIIETSTFEISVSTSEIFSIEKSRISVLKMHQ